MTSDQKDQEDPEVLPQPHQTPLFRTTQAARYRRQEAIRDIQNATGRKLICYVSGPAGYVARDDVIPLTDLLYNIQPDDKLDLMLHTLGGEVDAAEKIAGMLINSVGQSGELRIIVPDCAKSAGTLISLAAGSIIMSDTSELGPIDPQIVTTSPDGSQSSRPAQSYIDAYNDMVKQMDENPDSPALRTLIAKFDPVLLDMCRKALDRSRRFAERFLREGMFREQNANVTEIAGKLSSSANWLSHGAVISAEDALSVGLKIDRRDEHQNEWQAYWRLYCELRMTLNSNTEKIFESDYASLQM